MAITRLAFHNFHLKNNGEQNNYEIINEYFKSRIELFFRHFFHISDEDMDLIYEILESVSKELRSDFDNLLYKEEIVEMLLKKSKKTEAILLKKSEKSDIL